MPAVQALYEAKLNQLGIDVIGITQFNTTEADAQEFVEQHRLAFDNIFDPSANIAQQYNVQGVPHYIYLDREGHIARETSGARGVQLIDSILGQLVTEQTTQ